MESTAPLKARTLVWPGRSYPLGATWDGEGVNFALFSANAHAVDLCLFDASGQHETARVRLPEYTDQIWHGYLPDARPGQLYGFRVHGPYDPGNGHRFNANKLLLDPYAKAIAGDLSWSDSHFGYRIGNAKEDLSFDKRDNARHMPKCRVIDTSFTWGEDRRPRTSWEETVILETHAKGFTQLHPGVDDKRRGTFAGLVAPPVLDHLVRLGVTAVELLPIHHFLNDRHLTQRNLTNYWGYNTIGFFAPDPRFLSGGLIEEFKTTVKRLHGAGIEVILDVVYNHTAEGNHMGPTLSLRGIDNASYYRLADDPRFYMDYTGCGNSLNVDHPRVLQMVMDSLRYWVTEMHVDGFRFDLASALARSLYDVDQLGAFFTSIYQDPTLATTKLIAEPWDLGMGGYQVGNFPVNWTEWNGKYRDSVRKYWKGDMGMHSEIATRLGGSSDLYEHSGRLPSASINFITAHDGFTLHDLVAYNEKHNEANGENNNDGANDNESWNCGAEGPTDDPEINKLRGRQMRNFLATLMLSQGVPMLCAGDEIARTQGGNNNGYCQDDEISWLDWNLDEPRKQLLEFTSRLIHYRRGHPNFHRRSFVEKDPSVSPQGENIRWIRADGEPMGDGDWGEGGWMRTLGMVLSGDAPEIRNAAGSRVKDNDYLILLNSHHESVDFKLPKDVRRKRWFFAFDTARPDLEPGQERASGAGIKLEGRSLVVLGHAR